MNEPTYRQALSHAWHTVWHHKILWILGLLSLFVGQFGANDFIGKIWMVAQRTMVIGRFHGIFNLGLTANIALIWVASICLAVCLLVLVVSVISQGALIVGAAESLHEQKLNFKKAWHRATKHFWALLVINVLRALLITTIVLITGLLWTLILFSGLSPTLSSILSIIVIAVALFAGLSVTSWSTYSLCYSVLDGKGFMNAVKRGWTIFHHHILVSLELNVLLLIVLLILCAIFYALFFLSAAPALILWFIAGITGYFKLITVGLVLWAGILFLTIALMGAIYNAFSTTAWTYLFLKMHNEGVVSKVFHYLGKIVKR